MIVLITAAVASSRIAVSIAWAAASSTKAIPHSTAAMIMGGANRGRPTRRAVSRTLSTLPAPKAALRYPTPG